KKICSWFVRIKFVFAIIVVISRWIMYLFFAIFFFFVPPKNIFIVKIIFRFAHTIDKFQNLNSWIIRPVERFEEKTNRRIECNHFADDIYSTIGATKKVMAANVCSI